MYDPNPPASPCGTAVSSVDLPKVTPLSRDINADEAMTPAAVSRLNDVFPLTRVSRRRNDVLRRHDSVQPLVADDRQQTLALLPRIEIDLVEDNDQRLVERG